ncbi:MAG: hypothetical protein Q8Q07_01785 [Dehalococcoidales bacterium]|nr:hypothetical protein [Dehalococcoidales bacterium]MDZ4230911.1 hypothetical protein [Dehalococcoidales bacterium]
MNKLIKNLALAFSLLILLLVTAGCSSGFTAGNEGLTPTTPPVTSSGSGSVQSNTGGAVTIDVQRTEGENGSLTFNVAMNTHSVDLDQYDLAQLTILRDDRGNEYLPVSWDSASGGHHRQGTLTFPLPASVSGGEAKYLEMVIRDVAGIEERVLRWEL